MIEYHIFLTPPDATNWIAPFTVHAMDHDTVKAAFPSADRIYCTAKWGGLIRVA